MSDKVIYTVGGPVQASGGIYIFRDADEELLWLCQAGEFCYVLTARQMGKSSLMVATRERLAAKGIRSVEIDLAEMGTELSGLTVEQWYLGLIELIVDQLDLDVDYVAWWDERAHLGPTQRLSQFLRQVVLEQVSEPVVIFIDEIDSTLNLDFTDDFFAVIRGCYNARARDPVFKRLSFALLGVATPSDLITDPQRTPFNIGQRMGLTDFTNREAIPFADGLGLPPVEAGQVLTWILDWTGGHPYLTQRLCAAVAASPTKSWDAAAIDKLVEETFFGAQSAQDSNLRFVRDMLTQRAPDKAAVLKTYRRIHADKAVPDEERSLVKTHLKLSGIVKRKEDNLIVRNRIYEQVFNKEWIGQNMPQDWARRIAIISTLLVLLLGGLFGYYTYRQGQQTTEARAQAFIDSFQGTTSADVRITSLAGLFELPGYEDRARQLFYEELGPDEQRALFERANPQGVGAQLVTVIKGLYIELENNDQGNRLIEAMAQSLRELDDQMAVNLATEIEHWVTGRKAYAAGEYQQAVDAYSVALGLNDANPATHFDRAIAYAGLGWYEEALADFEETLRLDEERALIVDKEIRSSGALYDTLTASRAQYPKLVAIVPTPTLTHTPTDTPILPTPTATLKPTPSHTPTDTPIPPTPTLKPTPTHAPTDTPIPPTPTLKPTPSHTPTDTPPPSAPPGMVYVPAGEFIMGSDDDEVDYALQLCNKYDCDMEPIRSEQPQHRVYLDAFYIDRTEVTNAQYQRCVEAGVCQLPTTCDWGEPTYGDESRAQHPVVCVRWHDARTYCKWVGARLPTEGEWEKAARGTDGRRYPWGNTFDGSKLNFCDANCPYDWRNTDYDDGYARTAPVGSYPTGASPHGALDMLGNVWEWVADGYDSDYYSQSPSRNPPGPDSGEYRVMRGSAWYPYLWHARCAARYKFLPWHGNSDVGFRCARGPE